MKDVFLVVWSGGYDAPQYELRGADVEAWALARTWAAEMREGEDNVDVLRIEVDAMTVERLGSHGADVERTARRSGPDDAPDDGSWPRHEDFTFEDWQREVAEGDTRLGYEEWVRHQREVYR